MTVHSNDGLFTELLDGGVREFIIKDSLVVADGAMGDIDYKCPYCILWWMSPPCPVLSVVQLMRRPQRRSTDGQSPSRLLTLYPNLKWLHYTEAENWTSL